jgi:hypothetical protein
MPKKITRKRADIDIFLDSILLGLGTMDMRTFETIAWFAHDPLIAHLWTKRVLQMIHDLKKTPLTSKEIALLFSSVSQLRGTAFFDMWITKYSKASRKERETIFDFYRKLLRAVCTDDPFALKSNRKHSKEEIQQLLPHLLPASSKEAKQLGRIANACYHLSHAMFSDMNPMIVYDNYGPYFVEHAGASYLLAIKEFKSLQPLELWSETKNIPHAHIQGVYLYKRNVKMTVSALSHAMYKGNLINDLAYYALIIDGKPHPIENTKSAIATIEKQAAKIYIKIQSLEMEKRKQLYYFQKAYAYKHIYDYLGQPWQPGKDVLGEAKGRPLHKVVWPEKPRHQMKAMRKTFDPRTDFAV